MGASGDQRESISLVRGTLWGCQEGAEVGLGLPNVCWSWMRASSELGSPGPQEGQEHCSGQAGARMHEVAPSSEGRSVSNWNSVPGPKPFIVKTKMKQNEK